MSNFAPYQNLDFAFARLFETLSKSWPRSDIDFVRELVSHAEYGEALDNLVAIGANKGLAFGPAQQRIVAELAAAMGVPAPSFERASKSAAA